MNLFSELKDEGDFSGNFMDKQLVQFCFMGIIQVYTKMEPCLKNCLLLNVIVIDPSSQANR